MKMNVVLPTADAVVVMTRTFDAPRDLVWKVFTDPKHVAVWYGGHGFANPLCEMDVRPGGLWRHVMRTPDGSELAMEFVYVEVVRPERLVWKNAPSGRSLPPGVMNVVNTVTLEDAGRQTLWKLVARFDTLADRDFAAGRGFATIITQGCEKLESQARSLIVTHPEAP